MAEQSRIAPHLAALIERHRAWDLDTHDQRWALRRQSTPSELDQVYQAIMPHLGEMLAECDRFPLGELPESHRALFNLALAVVEVAPHVELYRGSVKVPNSFEESKLSASHGAVETWKG